MDENLAWLTQKTEDPKSNTGNFTFPSHTLNVIELWSNKKVATSPPFQVYPLFLAKNFVLPQVDQFLEGPTAFNKDGGGEEVELWKTSRNLQLLQSLKCYLSPDLVTKVKKEIYLPTLLFKCKSQNKVYLFDWSFLVLMKITLQFIYCN